MKKDREKKKTVPRPLLGKSEPLPFRVKNGAGRGKCLVICDHAGNRVPKALGTLGLSKADLQKHISWDPGTEDIGRHLCRKLDAVGIFSTYSRLVVDLNRGPRSRECMRVVSDGTPVPANERLTPWERKRRLSEIFEPYHDAINTRIEGFLKRGRVPFLLSLHSFTPKMGDVRRPWHMGILWDKEEALARRLAENLRRDNPWLKIGENEPYSLKSANLRRNTIATHAESRGLPYIILEFRQDLVGTRAGAARWAKILLRSLTPILADKEIYRLRKQRRKNPNK